MGERRWSIPPLDGRNSQGNLWRDGLPRADHAGVQVLAKFTLGQSDLLRRAIGKKIPEVLAEQRQKFVEGCCANPNLLGVPRGMSLRRKQNEILT